MPHLVEVHQEFREQGGEVIAVNYDLMQGSQLAKLLPKIETFCERQKIGFSVPVFDADDFDGINSRFDLPGPIPVTLAFDRNGKVVARQEGGADRERFVEMMQRALGEG